MPKQFFFGAGALYGLDNSTPTPTPVKFGTLQDVSVEFSADVKELYGANQFPAHIGRGKNKITCKAKSGQIAGALLNTLYFAMTQTAGELLSAGGEAGTIPPTASLKEGGGEKVTQPPYVVVVANGANFAQDLGVVYAKNGVPFVQVPTGEGAPAVAVGQYTLNPTTGTYTFAAADNGVKVLIDYLYKSSATGSSIAITNLPMGLAPTFQAVLSGVTDGKTMTLILNQCIASKLTIPTKNEDHVIVEFDFSAMADDNDQVGTLTVTE